MLKKWFNYIIQSKENQIKNKDYPRRYNILLLNIFIIVSALQISRNSEIQLIVKGKGNQQLLNKYLVINLLRLLSMDLRMKLAKENVI